MSSKKQVLNDKLARLVKQVREQVTESFCEFIYDLKYRWEDEQDYENFEDYRTVLNNHFGFPVEVTEDFIIRFAKDDMIAVLDFQDDGVRFTVEQQERG